MGREALRPAAGVFAAAALAGGAAAGAATLAGALCEVVYQHAEWAETPLWGALTAVAEAAALCAVGGRLLPALWRPGTDVPPPSRAALIGCSLAAGALSWWLLVTVLLVPLLSYVHPLLLLPLAYAAVAYAVWRARAKASKAGRATDSRPAAEWRAFRLAAAGSALAFPLWVIAESFGVVLVYWPFVHGVLFGLLVALLARLRPGPAGDTMRR